MKNAKCKIKEGNGINVYLAHATIFGELTASGGVSVLSYFDKSASIYCSWRYGRFGFLRALGMYPRPDAFSNCARHDTTLRNCEKEVCVCLCRTRRLEEVVSTTMLWVHIRS